MWDSIRYGLTVLMVITVPPAFAWWLIIHPLAPRLRSLGTRPTLIGMSALYFFMAAALYTVRSVLVGRDLGWDPGLFGIGVVLYAISVRVELRTRRHLKFRTLAGVPELAGETDLLLQEGIYSDVRHPRYLAVLIGLMSYALMINYTSLYYVAIAALPAIALVVALEERELSDRFGQAYLEYKQRVPAFLPRNLRFLQERPEEGP
ncbi:MAG: isoprenylcysteine carboxylmethyltransferase family protein [Gemmatimonadetes bacterium]|nr:isoprenylcysteine carboxylmethyltransferase family protein [Gemmatimonadota bacterium]